MEETKRELPSSLERLYNGLIKENPTFVLTLGMCPTLAVTTSAINGLGMGLTTMVVLALSNAFISLLRKVIPDKVRIPAFIVIIASFVTVMELLLEGYLPSLYDALGIYIPLIVVNCIILGRAESYASKNPVIPSFFDGVGMGLGFTFALTCIGLVRELLGSGKMFGYTVMPDSFEPVSIFVMAPGAFFVLAVLTALQNQIKIKGEAKGKDMSKIGSGCPGGCDSCGIEGCESRKFFDPNATGSVEEAALRREAGQRGPKQEAKKAGAESKAETKKTEPEKSESEKNARKTESDSEQNAKESESENRETRKAKSDSEQKIKEAAPESENRETKKSESDSEQKTKEAESESENRETKKSESDSEQSPTSEVNEETEMKDEKDEKEEKGGGEA